jgi:Tfp pilus assembly protein PilW
VNILHRKKLTGIRPGFSRGLTLVELMVSMTISLLVLVALVTVYVNVSRSNDELAKTNNLIENGRYALQLLETDLVHAGFWGGYLPQFDDLTSTTTPGDAPTAVPDPCLAYASWTGGEPINLIGIPVQTSDSLWSGAGCLSPAVARAGSDVIAVRHAETCVPGSVNCNAFDADRLYFQQSLCAAERGAGTVAAASADTMTFNSGAMVDDAYAGVMLRITSGTGAGQVRMVTDYDAAMRLATVSPDWTVVPDTTSAFALEYALSASAATLHKRDCIGTGTPATLPVTAGSDADLRRFISNIYYVADRPHPSDATVTVPTLMRAQFDTAAGTLAHRAPTPLIDGVEALRIEVGIDDVSETGEAVDFTTAIAWQDPTTLTQPRNRGDGVPDRYVRCTSAAPCSAADLANAVSVKLWVLARSREPTLGYVDDKSYCLGPVDAGGCPAGASIAAANDNYKRHVFSRTVRLVNVSARRETPFL